LLTRDYRAFAVGFGAEEMPMSEQLDSLRQAAMTLLTAAPAGAVLMAVRALLDGLELDRSLGRPATAPAAAAGPPPATLAAKVKATAPAQKADELAAWERLRQQVRAVRQARGITLRALAGELGLAASTVESALQTRRPPSSRLQQHLTDWLTAPEGAAMQTEPFRPNAPGHVTAAGDGVDQLAAR
jgi:lambda repressor-like predicted transcriptional regulator